MGTGKMNFNAIIPLERSYEGKLFFIHFEHEINAVSSIGRYSDSGSVGKRKYKHDVAA